MVAGFIPAIVTAILLMVSAVPAAAQILKVADPQQTFTDPVAQNDDDEDDDDQDDEDQGQETRDCSCKVCNNAECCLADDAGICSGDCDTHAWSVPADEQCSDSSEALLCCDGAD